MTRAIRSNQHCLALVAETSPSTHSFGALLSEVVHDLDCPGCPTDALTDCLSLCYWQDRRGQSVVGRLMFRLVQSLMSNPH